MGDARVVLTTLIKENLLSPGPKKLYVSYYRKRVYADLLPDGSIRFKDQIYTSPVPCALHMKRTLNPSLKTDAGWSSMYSAASGESLKDIKDRLHIRKRGTNVRSAQKEKKAVTPLPISKDQTANPAISEAAQSKRDAAPECSACQTEALTDVIKCSACHSKTHTKCANLGLQMVPPAPWFCESCLSIQANRILDFLHQTRRVLVERIAEQKKGQWQEKESAKEVVRDICHEAEEKASFRNKAQTESLSIDAFNEENVDGDKERDVSGKEISGVEVKEMSEDVTALVSVNPGTNEVFSNEGAIVAIADKATMKAEELEKVSSMPDDAFKENEPKKEEIIAVKSGTLEKAGKFTSENTTMECEEGDNQLVIAKAAKTSSAEEKLLVLIDTLIAEVSSKPKRAHLIANSTGATLVHLEKTRLVQLVEYGKREILAATRPISQGDQDSGNDGSENLEVDALIKIFDLRHQVLSSQSQFERTTTALTRRTEKHLRNAESEFMELEESRAVEARAITRVVDLIKQYSSDLAKCDQKVYVNEVLLESIQHRRNFIRSANLNDRFVPSYRYSSKLMTKSSDQLLLTVLLDKLRDITDSINEWMKMECHYKKMTASLNKALSLIGTKRNRDGVSLTLPPTPEVFVKGKIPPSRRLIERQIANYEVNLNAIRRNRARMRKTLSGILKIAREEHLSEKIVDMTEILYQKCRDLEAEEDEEQIRIKEEAEAKAKAEARQQNEENEHFERQITDSGEASEDKPEEKKQCLSTSVISNRTSEAAALLQGATPSDGKEFSLLSGSVETDAIETNTISGKSKSCADNRDNEKDLEKSSRAIADITSSEIANIDEGDDPRINLLDSPLVKVKGLTDLALSSFSICDKKGESDKSEQMNGQKSKPSNQDQQSFLDQALEVLSKQQHQQQRLERERIKQHRRMEEQRKEIERQQQQLEQRRQLEQQRLIEQEHQEREHQERERQERELQEKDCVEKQQRLERQRLEKIRLEHDLRERQHREHQRLEQEHHKQQRLEEHRRLEEQRRLKQQRLECQRQEKQRLEQQRLEQQRLEQQCHEQQQLNEKQRQEQQRRLELQRHQQEQQRQEHQSQFQHSKAPNLTQVVPSGSSHLHMLNQQQLQHQQTAIQQQQHSRQIQHPLYGDMSKGILMSSSMGNANHQDLYAQQTAQMSIEMHDVTRHPDSSHFVGSASGGLRGASYEVSRSAAQQPAPTVPRASFYGDGQMHSQDIFGSQGLPGPPRQLSDHHLVFANDLQQQQSDQVRAIGSQDFLMSRPYRGLNDEMQQRSGMEQADHDDVNMSNWQQ